MLNQYELNKTLLLLCWNGLRLVSVSPSGPVYQDLKTFLLKKKNTIEWWERI